MTRRSTPHSHALGAEIVCLAGYMRMLTAPLRREMAGPDDQHPPCPAAVLQGPRHASPRARGRRAHPWLHGAFRDRRMDDGPIIAQAAVPVLAGDSEADARRARAQGRAPALSAGAAAGRRRTRADRERTAVFDLRALERVARRWSRRTCGRWREPRGSGAVYAVAPDRVPSRPPRPAGHLPSGGRLAGRCHSHAEIGEASGRSPP